MRIHSKVQYLNWGKVKMELKEVYEKIGGDYDDVVRRLMGEKLVRKFLLKFLDDKSYADLERTLSEGDYKEAFRAAHTLKGVCQNLSLTSLYQVSSQLTEELRNEDTAVPGNPNISDYMSKVTAEYHKIIEAIQELE